MFSAANHMSRRAVAAVRRSVAPTRRIARAALPTTSVVVSSCKLPTGVRMQSGRSRQAPRLPGYETSVSIQDVFAQDSFNRRAMRDYLSKGVFEQVTDCMDNRTPISPKLADHFAQGLMRWAEERGATHFCHWFQPLTNYFAYKHDSMIKKEGDHVITRLTGKMLVIGEPDGSSFPNGGLRDTHEARGYTVWDPSSPCFIASHGTGTTLCIPSVFFSWKGHALDEKTPLLRSVEALDREAVALFQAMREPEHTKLHADSGVEQEFFLIDSDYYLARADIMQTGRSLIGAMPPKGQSLDDQYFGTFSDRFLRAMNEAEVAMWKLGIPQTTRHREVAPGQYEMAPVFSSATTSGDFNLLQMDILSKVCENHNLAVLFHEKPFANVNGSGKHNNWSVGTNKIPTLFEPGDNPSENIIFMAFLAATVRAVRIHGDVLRTAVCGAGNDHRLGANEAPPAIMSVYLGEVLTDAVNTFMGRDVPPRATPTGSLGVSGLPEFVMDDVDRNRTSPFAFTGNKFEFRAVGSSHNPTRSNTFLNTILADSLQHMRTKLEAAVPADASDEEVKAAFKQVVIETFEEAEAAMFDGDNYSQEWADEAERRGLLNLHTTTDAIDAFESDKNFGLFGKFGVLNEAEFAARVNVMREEYVTKVLTEASGLKNIVRTAVVPAAFETQTKIAGAIVAAKAASGNVDTAAQEAYLEKVAGVVNSLTANLEALETAVDTRPHDDLAEEARYCTSTVLGAMSAVRDNADALEGMCDSDTWSIPTYHEMLFHQS